jgi:glycosyltransferase involved in cell wall biosynthesis
MRPDRPRVAIITNIITTYRRGFYQRLFRRDDIHVEVFCQDYMPGMNLISIHSEFPDNVHIVNFVSANGEKIAWQYVPWIKILRSFDLVFIAGNPRVISDLLFGTFCIFFKKRVVLWTMAHSFRGNRFREGLRLAWTRIFPVIFVYTDREVVFLRNRGFNRQFIIGMNNGLDQRMIDGVIDSLCPNCLLKWKVDNNFVNRTIIISSARLESKNNFMLVLNALPFVINKIPNILWLVVGAGEEETLLKSTVQDMKLVDYVIFLGAIYDEFKLAPYFLSASAFVHPSAVGLSILHAFGYGLPVIVHGEESLHNPEYAAFVEGETGYNFKKDDAIDLASKVIQLLGSPESAERMGQNAQLIARNLYNVDIMVERFVEISNYSLDNDKF